MNSTLRSMIDGGAVTDNMLREISTLEDLVLILDLRHDLTAADLDAIDKRSREIYRADRYHRGTIRFRVKHR